MEYQTKYLLVLQVPMENVFEISPLYLQYNPFECNVLSIDHALNVSYLPSSTVIHTQQKEETKQSLMLFNHW